MKYLKLYWAFFRASFQADIEFRANFASRIVTDIIWYVAQIVSFEVLFNYTNTLGGWNRDQVRVFLGFLFLMDGLHMMMFSENLDFLSANVRKGGLDLLLTKPVSSQFIISCQRVSTAHLANIVMALVWLYWALSRIPDFHWWRLLWLLITLPGANAIYYTLRFFFAATSVIFVRAENLQYVWYHLYRLGMRPDSIYAPWLKFLVLTILPVGLIASVPTRLLLGMGDNWLALWSIFWGALALYLSHRFWRYTLTFYTSASS